MAQLPDVSRTRIQIAHRRRPRAGRAVSRKKPSHHVEPGEAVTVEIPAPPPAGRGAGSDSARYFYEDEDIAVINKPAGMIVHPGAGADTGTMVAALLHRFRREHGLSTVGGPLRPGIVHRLDKDTSGAMVIARNRRRSRKLVEDFRDAQVEKTYVALLARKMQRRNGHDRPARRARSAPPLAHDGAPPRRPRSPHGLARAPAARRVHAVEADLHTGRTHQIRVHFSALGAPSWATRSTARRGRSASGASFLPPLGRNFLHAARVAFDHPRTEKRIEVRAPLPPELVAYLRALGRVGEIADPAVIDAALKELPIITRVKAPHPIAVPSVSFLAVLSAELSLFLRARNRLRRATPPPPPATSGDAPAQNPEQTPAKPATPQATTAADHRHHGPGASGRHRDGPSPRISSPISTKTISKCSKTARRRTFASLAARPTCLCASACCSTLRTAFARAWNSKRKPPSTF